MPRKQESTCDAHVLRRGDDQAIGPSVRGPFPLGRSAESGLQDAWARERVRREGTGIIVADENMLCARSEKAENSREHGQ